MKLVEEKGKDEKIIKRESRGKIREKITPGPERTPVTTSSTIFWPTVAEPRPGCLKFYH